VGSESGLTPQSFTLGHGLIHVIFTGLFTAVFTVRVDVKNGVKNGVKDGVRTRGNRSRGDILVMAFAAKTPRFSRMARFEF
jgi:hypothetical protein